jgi:hypothetical protein
MSTNRSVIRHDMRNRLAPPFAIAGFVVAIILFGLLYFARLYLEPHGLDVERTLTEDGVNYQLLFLILCPPSLEAMALDNAGPVVNSVGVLFIAVENAVLYGLVGAGVGRLWRKRARQNV